MILVLKNKYKITLLAEKGSLKESINSIAYTLDITINKTAELVKIGVTKYDSIKLYEYINGVLERVFDGYVYTLNGSDKDRTIQLTCKERTINMEESEEEYVFAEGTTATQRVKQYCKDWGVPLDNNILDTKIGLAKCRNKNTVYTLMWNELKETAQKGGKLYKYRMESKLYLFELGTNSTVYKLDSIREESSKKATINGAVTRVKVLGKNDKDTVKSPILGTFKSGYEKYIGTFQKIVQDDNITTYANAQEKAISMFYCGDETWTIECSKDIPVIRSGDKISLDNADYYVCDITHDIGNDSMTITAMKTLNIIRGKYYAGN